MRVKEIMKLIRDLTPVTLRGSEDVEITGLAYHSARVGRDYLFAALPGARSDGLNYIDEALKKEAAAILFPRSSGNSLREKSPRTTWIGVDDVRLALAAIADAFYRHPSGEMTVVAITGTNGKTTLTYLVEAMAAASGISCGVIGTIAYRMGPREFPAERTTPESPDLQSILRWMADDGARMVAMEVSSHALDYRRVDATRFDYALFTNLSLDHLDFHGDMENYYQAKRRLFTDFDLQAAVVNLDDSFGRRLAAEVGCEVITYGRQDECHIRLREEAAGPGGLELDLEVPGGLLKLSSPLLGYHNIENLLAAAALGWRLGFPTEAIQEGAAALASVPGRFQKVSGPGEPTVLVDYAHTPEALESLLKSARDITAGRLILVFGCGGNRDRQKRPLMGMAAAQGADFTFITSDNPRGEPPERIIEEIREGYLGVKHNGYQVVMDRREAIFLASDMSSPEDTVVIAGKGHEDYQVFSDRKVHFDDREIAREAFRRVRS